jgi:hypothetical protein
MREEAGYMEEFDARTDVVDPRPVERRSSGLEYFALRWDNDRSDYGDLPGDSSQTRDVVASCDEASCPCFV